MSSNPTVRDRIPPPLTAYRRRLILWALTVLVGALLMCTGHFGAALAGVFLIAAIGGPGLILDRPNPTHT
ncbi:hypothetical protein ACHABQ_03055 [Nesterenkonia aurantiaca]|uniref:hypothetical protein n=1 Tax=Nesterenkonia aurantiaca TaxID=1436010 RepID=UPI003EE6D209